ncbi:MAG: serine hydroxymethyltransferase [Candidatus Bathyarchaeia archaeon]
MSEAGDFYKRFLKLYEASLAHEKYRGRECLNLIASEGLTSPAVDEMLNLCRDLRCRYSEGENDLSGHVHSRHYQGQKYMTVIEDATADLMKEVIGCDWIDIRPISGLQANQVTFWGLSEVTKNRRMLSIPLEAGAHSSHDYTGNAGEVIGLEVMSLKYDVDELNLDVEGSEEIIKSVKPGIVTFGGSLFLFPNPIRKLAEAAKDVGAYIVYDAAHVLGLIVGGEFQDPLREGADFITSSTHKTFPGPQGGIVCANLSGGSGYDERMVKGAKKIQHAIFPLSTSNTHPGRFPALGVAALEMKVFGKELAAQTVKNAQTAGRHLYSIGLMVLGRKLGYTRSHQIALDVRDFGGGRKVAQRLEEVNIIVNKQILPYDKPGSREDPSGLRLGFQYLTRMGFEESDVKHICEIIGDVIKSPDMSRNRKEALKMEVIELVRRFNSIKYGFKSLRDALNHVNIQ